MGQSLNHPPLLVVVAGPTAIGKTALSIRLARHFNCPILSFDSRQFYREMSIGTAKPDHEELAAAEHHFIDCYSVSEPCSSGQYEQEALQKLDQIFKKYPVCVAVGGSGLYINALCYGIDDIPSDQEIRDELAFRLAAEGLESLQKELKSIDPEFFDTTDIKNPRRIMRAIEAFRLTGKKYSELRLKSNKKRPFNTFWIGLEMDIQELYDRINIRVDQMVEKGLIDEVRSLHAYRGQKPLKTVGYREIFDYLEGKCSLDQAIEKIKVNTRRYAKRQISWFKRNPEINWFHPENDSGIMEKINSKFPV